MDPLDEKAARWKPVHLRHVGLGQLFAVLERLGWQPDDETTEPFHLPQDRESA